MAEFFATLQTTGAVLAAAMLTCGAIAAVLFGFDQAAKLAAARRGRRRGERWDSTEAEVSEWAEILHRMRTGPQEPPDDDVTIGATIHIAASPLARQPAEDVSWLAPTGAYPLVTPTSYGTPALLHAPAELRWARWQTPRDGLPPVLTAAGAV